VTVTSFGTPSYGTPSKCEKIYIRPCMVVLVLQLHCDIRQDRNNSMYVGEYIDYDDGRLYLRAMLFLYNIKYVIT